MHVVWHKVVATIAIEDNKVNVQMTFEDKKKVIGI